MRLDFDAAVQCTGTLAVEVIAKRLYRRGSSAGFSSANMTATCRWSCRESACRPALLPVIQIRLRFLHALEALTLQRRFSARGRRRIRPSLSVRISHAARQSDRAVMLQHVAVERIKRGIVNVGRDHTFAEIIQHHTRVTPPNRRNAFSCSSARHASWSGTLAVEPISGCAQGQHEQPRAPVLATDRITHHGPVP